MYRLQMYYPKELLDNLRLYAASRGIPLAQALREATVEFAKKPDVKILIDTIRARQKKMNTHPVLTMAGILRGGPRLASTTVDEIYDEK